MDAVNGRSVSRGRLVCDDERVMRSDHHHGALLVASVALLAEGADRARRERWHALVKGWIARDTVCDLLTAPQFDVADLARLRTIADGPATPAPAPLGHRPFAAMDRAVHRRPRFTACVAMASDRIAHIAHYECGDGEHPRGWHTGAGPPSTRTACPAPRSPPGGRRTGRAASGANPCRTHAGPAAPPTARTRSSASTSKGSAPPWRPARRGSAWRTRSSAWAPASAAPTASPSRRSSTTATWGSRARPPSPAARTGVWSDINAGGRPERRTRRRQTLWLDHGTDPADARYAYVLLPGAARDEAARRAEDPRWLRVLANDASRRAVEAPAPGLTVSRPAAVLLRRQGRTATLCVSDPTRTGESVELEWDRPVREVPDAPDPVEIPATKPRLRLRVTPGEACVNHVCEAALSRRGLCDPHKPQGL